MTLSGIDASDYTSLISQNSSQTVSSKISTASGDDASDTELLEACQEFEKYMIEQIYKGMESTIDRAEEKSDYEEYFGDMMVQEYAEKIEDQGGLGLAQQLYESMKRNEGDITLS
jgi:flagellar protein FlgJ